jgi:7,8-dihydroneopterin aldolase/epimerase/oxygenase
MTGSNDQVVHAFRIADASASMRHMFIRDLVLECLIGVHKHEQRKPQRIRINVDLAVREAGRTRSDKLTDVVDYEEVADRIRAIVASGHVNLVETLAENIAEMCLADPRIAAVRVRVEKLDIFPDAAAVGVEIERSR